MAPDNPFAHGTDTELADKVLAGETYTEPHYLRQAGPYLGHALRTLRDTRIPVTVATLAEAMVPDMLEWYSRSPPDDQDAKRTHDFVDGLSAKQRRGSARATARDSGGARAHASACSASRTSARRPIG